MLKDMNQSKHPKRLKLMHPKFLRIKRVRTERWNLSRKIGFAVEVKIISDLLNGVVAAQGTHHRTTPLFTR